MLCGDERPIPLEPEPPAAVLVGEDRELGCRVETMELARRVRVSQGHAEAKKTVGEREAGHLEGNLSSPPFLPAELLGRRLAGTEQPAVGVPEFDGDPRGRDPRRELDRKPDHERSAGEELPLLLTVAAFQPESHDPRLARPPRMVLSRGLLAGNQLLVVLDDVPRGAVLRDASAGEQNRALADALDGRRCV